MSALTTPTLEQMLQEMQDRLVSGTAAISALDLRELLTPIIAQAWGSGAPTVDSAGRSLTVTTLAARDALTVFNHDRVLVTDDGDGKWALYMATADGTGAAAGYLKISGADLLHSAMSAAQVKNAYESNPDTYALTGALVAKINAALANNAVLSRSMLPSLNLAVPFLTVTGAGSEAETIAFDQPAFFAAMDAYFAGLPGYAAGDGALSYRANKTFAAAGPANPAPVASSVAIAGTPMVGQVLSGTYTYTGNPEGATGKQWYRADNAAGLNRVAIPQAVASAYTLAAADQGKYLQFSVTPVSSTGPTTGTAVSSAYTALIAAPAGAGGAETDLAQNPTVNAATTTRTGNNIAITSPGTVSNPAWGQLRLPANGSGWVRAGVTASTPSGQLILNPGGTSAPTGPSTNFGIYMASNGIRTILNGNTQYNNVAATTANRIRLRGALDTDGTHKIFYEYSTDNGATWVLLRKELSGGVDLFLKAILSSDGPALNLMATSGLAA